MHNISRSCDRHFVTAEPQVLSFNNKIHAVFVLSMYKFIAVGARFQYKFIQMRTLIIFIHFYTTMSILCTVKTLLEAQGIVRNHYIAHICLPIGFRR